LHDLELEEARHEAREALLRSRELLNETQRLAKLGGWEWDVDSGRAIWTDQVYAIYGVDRGFDTSDLDGILGYFHEDYRETLRSAFESCVRDGIPYSLEARFTNADGDELWCRTSGEPVIEKGRVIKVRGNFADITERKRTEDVLRKSLQSLTQAETIAHLGYFERNWQTGEGYWSDGFCRLLGIAAGTHYDHERFMGFIHPEDRESVATHIRDALAHRRGMNVDFRIVRTDGTVLDIHGIANNSYDETGQPLLTRGTFQDITEARRLAQESARLRAQFEQAQRVESVGRLAGAWPMTLITC